MITRIRSRFFKTFEKQDFQLGPVSLLAGPNNSSKAKNRQGAPITRPDELPPEIGAKLDAIAEAVL